MNSPWNWFNLRYISPSNTLKWPLHHAIQLTLMLPRPCFPGTTGPFEAPSFRRNGFRMPPPSGDLTFGRRVSQRVGSRSRAAEEVLFGQIESGETWNPHIFSPKNHRSGAGIYWIEGNFCVFFWGGLGGEKANFHFNDSGTKCGVMVRRNNNMVDGSDAGSRSSKVHEKKASNTFMFTRKK